MHHHDSLAVNQEHQSRDIPLGPPSTCLLSFSLSLDSSSKSVRFQESPVAVAMDSFYPEAGFDPKSLANSIVVIPTVSIGNLPQLAADILIYSLGLKRVGLLGTGETCAPFVGQHEQGQGLVGGGLEVYGQPGGELYILQQRAPVLKSRKAEHVELLQQFIQTEWASAQIATVLVVTSLDAASQGDAQLATPLQSLLPPQHEASTPEGPLKRLGDFPSLTVESYPPFLPGAGLAKRLLESLTANSPPHGLIAAWCVEGDNRGDAHGLAGALLNVLGINDDVRLQEPPSWRGLFGGVEGWSGGSGLDSELYG